MEIYIIKLAVNELGGNRLLQFWQKSLLTMETFRKVKIRKLIVIDIDLLQIIMYFINL